MTGISSPYRKQAQRTAKCTMLVAKASEAHRSAISVRTPVRTCAVMTDEFEVIYQRPTSDSFDYWINATNGTDVSPGWSWNDVYPVGLFTQTF
jgi:hypothetical protein